MDEKFDGAKLKEFRNKRGINQRQLADRAGISNSYLSDIEVGRTNPSLKTLLKLAKVLDADISAFVIKEQT